MGKTRILIDGRSMTPHLSGIGRYNIELVRGYVRRFGEDAVTVIVNEPPAYLPYSYLVCPYNRHKIIDNMRFSRWLERQDYDIFHSGDMTGSFWHKAGVRHIITCHDLMYFIVPGFFGRINPLKASIRKMRIKILFKYIVKDADIVISVSKTTHDDLKRIYGIDSIVLREGINRISREGDGGEYRGLKHGSFFLYVGCGSAHKNIDFLTSTFLASTTDKLLVICGKGHRPMESDRIIYTDYIDDCHLDYLYKNCAAFIFPSLYEGFGMPILEALSYHCRVFSSDAGSLGEFSAKVVNFFDPNNPYQLKNLIEQCDSIPVDTAVIDSYLKGYDWTVIWEEFHNKFTRDV